MLIHKALGQIPYHLARDHGWECEIAFCQHNDAAQIAPPDYDAWVRRTRLGITRSRVKKAVLFTAYIASRARRTDVLILYHLTSESLLYASLYKALNPAGIAVLKLDIDRRGIAGFVGERESAKRWALMSVFRRAPLDFVTVETKAMLDALHPYFASIRFPLYWLPVGFSCANELDIGKVLRQKENVILTVGRLGTYQKNNEALLEALEQLGPDVLRGWQVWMVGSREGSLDAKVDRFRKNFPALGQILVVRDFVESRDELYDLYRRARVYCLTSRWESFATVLGEALYYGCYLVSTNVGAASDLTDGGRDGDLVGVEDTAALAGSLREVVTGTRPTDAAARRTHERVRTQYRWSRVVARLVELVERHQRPEVARVDGRSPGARAGAV